MSVKKYIFVRSNGGMLVKVPFKDISYIKALGDYVEIHMSSSIRYVIHCTLLRMGRILPKTFFRCHRSFIVNTDRVISVEGGTIYLEGDHIAWMGDHYRKGFLKNINFIGQIDLDSETDKRYRFMNMDLHPEDKEIVLADDIIYVSEMYKQLDFMCPCGCKEIITLNTNPDVSPFWEISGNSVTPGDMPPAKCGTRFSICDGVAETEKQIKFN